MNPTSVTPASPLSGKHVGLALSGGGYRAALFHAGVIDGLNQLGIPLTSITSVSGGSIIASLYLRGMEPKAFVADVTANRFNIGRKLIDIDHAAGMAFLFSHAFRLSAQSEVLDEAGLSGAKFDSVNRRHVQWMIITTDLGWGSAVGLTPNGFMVRNMLGPLRPLGFYSNVEPPDTQALSYEIARELRWMPTTTGMWPGNAKASTLVAASGAFPLAFEPLTVNEFQLVDGGVSDNSAMTLLLDADFLSRSCGGQRYSSLVNWRSDVVIQSDASQAFEAQDASYGPIGAAARAVDTTVARVGMRPIYFEDERLRQASPHAILLSPIQVVTNDKMSADWNKVSEDVNQIDNMSLLHISDSLRDDPFESPDTRYAFRLESAFLRAGMARDPYAKLERVRGPIKNSLEGEIADDAATFFRSPTLKDRYSANDGQRIFRLGWLLAMLNGPAIANALVATPDQSVSSAREQIGKYCLQ